MEEVYTALEGKAFLLVGGEEHVLEPGTFARVGPGETRKLITRDEGARVLAIGAVPGKVYVPPEFTEEGQPDPMAG
jgi:quercetin dioxygenase-like cupin family protein